VIKKARFLANFAVATPRTQGARRAQKGGQDGGRTHLVFVDNLILMEPIKAILAHADGPRVTVFLS
jgi:hypothetical protein